MKSAANKGGPVPTPALSHIPLPRRKSSSKSEKGLELNDTDSELGGDTRSQTKTSLLSGTSFCCVSGQKEDYLPPPPRKRNNTPLAPPGKGLIRNRRGRIIESHSEDAISQSSEMGLMKQSHEDIKIRPPGDSRLRPPDQRGRMAPSSPQRKISRDPLPKNSEAKKSSEMNRKLCKDLSPQVVGPRNPFKSKDNKIPREETKSIHCDDISNGTFHPSDETLENTANHGAYRASGISPTNESMDSDENLRRREDGGVMKNSHDSDDFDCPCCDRTSTLGPVSEAEIHVFTSCEVVASPSQDVSDKERALLLEIEALKGDLQAERSRLRTHRDRVQLLEEEMAPLKDELEKEKELRKIAEDKLLQVLDHERRRNEKRTESKGTQKDDVVNASGNSPLMMGYESRVRRYQTYITKLERDNLTLVNELKKFGDMSPGCQEDQQAKQLLEKLGEMQRSSHQQQLQYESCLDEVANRLVHTLLVQKRLEEECKVLHLRVEQLEQENGTLIELIDDNENENVIKSPAEDEINSKVQNKLPLHHPITSTPVKKNCTASKPSISSDERISQPPKILNEPKSPVSKPGCTSKIPAFSSPAVVLKKSPNESKTTPVPNLKSRTLYSESPKGKRKRPSKNCSPAEKDSNQRLKTQRRAVPGQSARHQQVWSFSCEVDNSVAVPESSGKIADAFQKKDPPASSRTRDEGYSTMSSDLQPSATYVRCVSDDSVTECLDGSMCSSSDSGFGPLHQVANSKPPVSTVRHKEQIVPPPAQSTDGVSDPLCDTLCDAPTLDHVTSRGKTWPKKSSLEERLKVETAEKATLTEPEERLWREKALAPFIDESIWSLYSSEGEPLVVITEDNNGLERVASDTLLYLKDAVHELEDSMHRGLHNNSGTLLNFDSGKSRPVWSPPTRSSSTSSLQSSTSLQVVSDELEDVDLLTGSRDADLSSASDAEGESLEHKDFVERWLQNEVAPGTASKPLVEEEEESKGVVKEFNGDFYKLCSVGSLRSLDHLAPLDEPKMFKPRHEPKEGCGTAWIHLQAKPELSDPTARISLLNSLKAPTSSSSEEEEEILVIHTSSHLHRICRERRQKAKANHPFFEGKRRSSVVGRHELFYRFGDKEKEAIACFDFLEELPTTPPSDHNRRLRLPNLWNQPLSRNMSRDCELLDHISLSDSCAESYSSTPDSYEETS